MRVRASSPEGGSWPSGLWLRRGGKAWRRAVVPAAGCAAMAALGLLVPAAGTGQLAMAGTGWPAPAVRSLPVVRTTATVVPRGGASATVGACSGLDFVSARGSGEPWYSPASLRKSPETAAVLTGIRQALSSKGVRIQVAVDQLGTGKPGSYVAKSVDVLTSGLSWNPLKWDADWKRIIRVNLPEYLGGEQDGEAELDAYLVTTYRDCLPTGQEPMVVLAGYSQGAMLVHNVLNLLVASEQTGPASLVKGAVLVADPERTKFSDVANRGNAKAADDGICPAVEGLARRIGLQFNCGLFGPVKDVPRSFASSTVAVCDRQDVVCDTSADLSANPVTDFIDIKHGKWVHTDCHSYCGSQVKAAGRLVGFNLISDGLGATPAPGSWAATEVPLPAGADEINYYDGMAASCPSPTVCVAAGTTSAPPNGGGADGLLLTDSGSSLTAIAAPLPADAVADTGYDSLDGVACASASVCVAVGQYSGSSSVRQGLLETGFGSSWTAADAPLPANAAAGSAVQLVSVACPSTSACVAVGSYTDSSGQIDGLLLTGFGSSWAATEAPLPTGAPQSAPGVQLDSVACASPSACVVVGAANDNGVGDTYGLIETGMGSSWTAVEGPVPANGNPLLDYWLNAVACPSASKCIAVGVYSSSAASVGAPGLIVTGLGTSWSAAQAPLPYGTASEGGRGLLAISCESAADCVAVGEEMSPSGDYFGVLETGSGASWTPAEVPVTASAGAAYNAAAWSVSCVPSVCAVLAGNGQELIAGSRSSWTVIKVPLPPGAAAPPDYGLDAVSCGSAARCIAAGWYTDASSALADGLLATGAG